MKSNSKLILTFLLLLCLSFCGFTQSENQKNVTLIEKRNGKRLELFAKNEDSISYVVFLRVTTDNYRRTSNRPVLTTVAPKAEKHLLTLIKLVGKPDDFEKQFIINEVSQNLSFRKDDDDLQINFNDALKTKKITLYESDDCVFCEETKDLFNKNRISFEEKHITKDYNELIKRLKSLKKPIENIENESFIMQIKSDFYIGITNKKELIEVLKDYIK